MKFKLVAIDMDGTLLNSQNEVSNRTRMAIEEASKRGAHIVLATGRLLRSAVNYAEELRLEKPIIACNGAVIVDEDKNILYEKSIKMDTVGTIMEIGAENNMYYHFYDRDSFYSNIHDDEILKFYNTKSAKERGREVKINIFNNIEEVVNNKDLNVYKFLFLDEDRSKLDDLKDKLSHITNINICSSWHNNIEVMDKEVSKGNSLKRLCERLNISRDQVIAIGDNENDISMIDYAGLGVAMGNGVDKVKKYADTVTDTNNEDGVAKIIEKYILQLGDEA